MSCGCGGAKKKQFKVDSYINDGWYYIDLCEGYKLKYKTNVYYLVNGDYIWINTKESLINWALENCGLEL